MKGSFTEEIMKTYFIQANEKVYFLYIVEETERGFIHMLYYPIKREGVEIYDIVKYKYTVGKRARGSIRIFYETHVIDMDEVLKDIRRYLKRSIDSKYKVKVYTYQKDFENKDEFLFIVDKAFSSEVIEKINEMGYEHNGRKYSDLLSIKEAIKLYVEKVKVAYVKNEIEGFERGISYEVIKDSVSQSLLVDMYGNRKWISKEQLVYNFE